MSIKTNRANAVQPTDQQLAEAAIAGDTDAFGTLVVRLRAPLIGYVTGITGQRDDAEDVAQQAFLDAWRHLDSLREPARIAKWIYRIAHNRAVRRARLPKTVPLAVEPHDSRHHAGAERERLVNLMVAVSELDEHFREVVTRKHFGGFSGDEIAAQLGIAAGTVRSRLSRAYAQLRASLSSEPSD